MYRGHAHSTGGSSQQGLLPEVYRTASTYDRTLSKLWNQEPNKTRTTKSPNPRALVVYIAGDALRQQPMGAGHMTAPVMWAVGNSVFYNGVTQCQPA